MDIRFGNYELLDFNSLNDRLSLSMLFDLAAMEKAKTSRTENIGFPFCSMLLRLLTKSVENILQGSRIFVAFAAKSYIIVVLAIFSVVEIRNFNKLHKFSTYISQQLFV